MRGRLRRASGTPVPGTSGDLWLRSDLRRQEKPAFPARPLLPRGRRLAVPRKPLTWILTGVILLTSAAAGQAYLAAEPIASDRPIPASAGTSGKTAIPEVEPVGLRSLEQLSANQQILTTELEHLRHSNLELLARLEKLQASLLPDAAGDNTSLAALGTPHPQG